MIQFFSTSIVVHVYTVPCRLLHSVSYRERSEKSDHNKTSTLAVRKSLDVAHSRVGPFYTHKVMHSNA